MTLEVLSISFSSDVIYIELLELCVVLIFPSCDNRVFHMQLLF